MTEKYTPKVGDRVRFTAEGVVEGVGADIDVRFERGTYAKSFRPGVGTWERLPDVLPTTPGSVVRKGDYYLMRTVKGWATVDGNYGPDDLILDGATVLFDAGSVKL